MSLMSLMRGFTVTLHESLCKRHLLLVVNVLAPKWKASTPSR